MLQNKPLKIHCPVIATLHGWTLRLEHDNNGDNVIALRNPAGEVFEAFHQQPMYNDIWRAAYGSLRRWAKRQGVHA